MKITHCSSFSRTIVLLFMITILPNLVCGQCPLSKNDSELTRACSCSYVQAKLNIQCSSVNLTKLLTALRDSEDKQPIELLHVNNCNQSLLPDDSFYDLRVTTIHFAQCKIKNISGNAFRDLEDSLKSLNLPDNQLNEDCLATIRKLRGLTSLDLSNNQIKFIPANAFKGLALDTLNLMENNLNDSVSSGAFQGLEKTLKNLNLKGTGLTKLPAAIRNLTAIAFLDLAQNSIQESPSRFFINMASLSALSLERNQLVQLESDTFTGLSDTMTSLSLLNNQFREVPTQAIATLKELRVLDLGFNQISTIGESDFQNATSLTLLALDGNPLSTLPYDAFKHLKATLKGLSIGGRSFVCDCNIRWITEWVREYDLQVTSRERNPQFCGFPSTQRNKNLYLLRPAQLVCPETTTIITTSTTTTETTTSKPSTTETNKIATTVGTTTTTTVSTSMPNDSGFVTHESTTNANITPSSTIRTTPKTETTSAPITTTPPTSESPFSPPLLVRSTQNQRAARKDHGLDINIREAHREDSNIVISWDVTSSDVPGFRIIYRTFGDTTFTKRADLSLRVRKFRLTNVPPNECLVVCVISTDELNNITADGVPRANCRELKSESHFQAGHAEIDKIVIIAALAAICAAVIIAVIIFVCFNRRRKVKQHPLPPPIVTLPPLEPMKPEWDNASAYSSRSIPRARMYHLGRNGSVNSAFLPDDARSHISHMSVKHPDPGGSIINGSQYNGYMNPHTNTLPNPYPLGRPDTNRSSKSLAQMSYQGGGTNTRKKRPQPRNGKWSSMSNSGSVHSLSGYDTENGYFHPNPWAGSEMDHYPSGNHITSPYTKRDYT